MSRLLTISLFIKPCQESERVCSLKRCSISCVWQLLFVPWIYSFGEYIYLPFFFFSPTIQEPSRTLQGTWQDMPLLLWDQVSDTLNQVVSYLSLVTDMWCPLEDTDLELFSWGSPQMAGELNPPLQFLAWLHFFWGKPYQVGSLMRHTFFWYQCQVFQLMTSQVWRAKIGLINMF